MTEDDELFENIINKCPFIQLNRKGLINRTRLKKYQDKKRICNAKNKNETDGCG